MDLFNNDRQCLLEQTTQSVRLPINGMTCQSCVRNIESNIRTKLGVISIKVNLQEKAGYVEYDPQLTDPKQIASEIDDMGFDCEYLPDKDDDDEIAARIIQINQSKVLKTRISIEGMRCQSCVKNIEGNIGSQPGIKRISVNLEEKCAAVDYDSDLHTDQAIAEMISDMGFTATVLSDNSVDKLEKFDAVSNKKGKFHHKCLHRQMNSFLFTLQIFFQESPYLRRWSS